MPPELDAILDLEEAAAWLRMSKKDLVARSKGRNPRIPGIWINKRVVRFHPRSVLAKLASENVPLPTVSAMFNLKEAK